MRGHAGRSGCAIVFRWWNLFLGTNDDMTFEFTFNLERDRIDTDR
jgi:hypothetical protein